MQSSKIAFTRAASGTPDPKPGFAVFWLMVLAIAILDESERREKDRKHEPCKVPRPTVPTP